ncbi:hypothetical protein CSUB01_10689 [Colletotrichum sublineola]|uniref:Uncharacterized protein n=1 Tax=Colletotrichum sublineola TaxID=1173701 RepID=A0A066XTI4_COLSU|nr:hypothetical protein CSUB01_10689 [Colletotrichum sublineola]
MSPDLSPISTEPRSSVTTRTANPADEIRAIRLNLARRAFLRQYFELTGAMESDSDKYVEAFRWRDKTALRALGVSFNTILGLTEVALAQQQATGSTPREPNPRQSERRQHYRAVMEAGVPVYLLHPKNFLESAVDMPACEVETIKLAHHQSSNIAALNGLISQYNNDMFTPPPRNILPTIGGSGDVNNHDKPRLNIAAMRNASLVSKVTKGSKPGDHPGSDLCAFLARRSASRLFTALNYSRIEALVNAVMGRTGERTTSSFFIRKNCGIISSATVNQVTGRTFWYDSLWADGYSTSRYANDIDRLCKFYKTRAAKLCDSSDVIQEPFTMWPAAFFHLGETLLAIWSSFNKHASDGYCIPDNAILDFSLPQAHLPWLPDHGRLIAKIPCHHYDNTIIGQDQQSPVAPCTPDQCLAGDHKKDLRPRPGKPCDNYEKQLRKQDAARPDQGKKYKSPGLEVVRLFNNPYEVVAHRQKPWQLFLRPTIAPGWQGHARYDQGVNWDDTFDKEKLERDREAAREKAGKSGRSLRSRK